MLEAKNIHFSYNKQHKILDNISMSFGIDEIVSLIGPSGCGKSTFSKILAGYIKPDSGEVLFNNSLLPKSGYCPVQLIYQHPEKAVNPKWHMKQILKEYAEYTEEEQILTTEALQGKDIMDEKEAKL